MRAHWSLLVAVAPIALAACRQPLSPCVETAECLSAEVCLEGRCRQVCNTNAGCPASENCSSGACMPARDAGPSDRSMPDVLFDAATDRGLVDHAAADAAAGDHAGRDATGPGDGSAGRDSAVAVDVPLTDGTTSDAIAVDSRQPDAVPVDRATADAGTVDAEPCRTNALAFGGAHHVEVDLPATVSETLPITVEAWIRPGPLAGSEALVSHHDASAMRGYVLRLVDGQLEFLVYDSAQPLSVRAPDPLVADRWYHVAATDDGAEMRVFVDGVAVRTGVAGSLHGAPGLPIHLGAAAAVDGEYFMGTMDEVRISNSVRYPTSFVPQLTPLSSDAQTIALWHLDQGTGQTVIDVSDHAYDGELGDVLVPDGADPTWTRTECLVDRYPAPAGSCAATFSGAPDFVLCLESPVWCSFHMSTLGRTCRESCTTYGVECLAAFDNNTPVCDVYSWVATCDSVFGTQICTCAKPRA